MNSQCRKVLQDGENSKKRKKKGPGVSRVEPSGTRKAQQQQSRFKSLREDELRGPPTRTRASLKRRHYEPSSTKVKVEKKINQEDQPINGETDAIMEEPSNAPSITRPLPDKQTLELVIDTLQRKDIYEIFAEPVDPEEVEDYYEIIEEPMDFGTMRAKLHEGLYTSLEQFEHDVFLISGNAMHFNSSGTIFFRQAHGIHKLAKRVFHVLRTNPENFESEFSGSRRKSGRKSQDETNEFDDKLLSKTSEKTSTATVDSYLKNTSSLIHRSFLEYPRISRTSGDTKRCESIEVDRRSTYKPDLNLNNETRSKSLIQFDQQELTYSQSLMQFVKGLGPTAQMVANRKLENLKTQPQIPTGQMWFNSSRSGLRSGLNDGVTNSNGIDFDLQSINGIDRGESIRRSVLMSYSGGSMDSVVTSMSIPAWLRQEPSGPSALNLGFFKSKLGKMNEGGVSEGTSFGANKPFDPKDLNLQL